VRHPFVHSTVTSRLKHLSTIGITKSTYIYRDILLLVCIWTALEADCLHQRTCKYPSMHCASLTSITAARWQIDEASHLQLEQKHKKTIFHISLLVTHCWEIAFLLLVFGKTYILANRKSSTFRLRFFSKSFLQFDVRDGASSPGYDQAEIPSIG
jgi:hypothetical protein